MLSLTRDLPTPNLGIVVYAPARVPVKVSEPCGNCFNRSRCHGSAEKVPSETHTLLQIDQTPLCLVLGLRSGSGELSGLILMFLG